MTVKVAIDGNKTTGEYRVDCECGDNWSGEGERKSRFDFCPAMPIAECVVHMKLCHPDGQLELRFSDRYRNWLFRYWDVQSYRISTGAAAAH